MAFVLRLHDARFVAGTVPVQVHSSESKCPQIGEIIQKHGAITCQCQVAVRINCITKCDMADLVTNSLPVFFVFIFTK